MEGNERPHYPGIMTWGDGRLVLVGGGHDGDPPPGNACGTPNPRPSQSRELWIGEVSVPAALEAPAFDPDRIDLTTSADHAARLT